MDWLLAWTDGCVGKAGVFLH